MSGSLIRRLVLATYPAGFRERYGDELAAVAAECGDGWRVTFDLALSAAKARLNPDLATSEPEGRRLRLQTTTSTVFALWTWSVVAVALFARAVDDQPVPGLRSWGWSAYAVGNVIFELSAGAILITGFAYWLRVVVPAARTRDRRTLVPAVMPVAVVLLWLVGTGIVATVSNHIRPGNYRHISAQGPHSAGGWALLAVYALFTVICVAGCTVGVRRALASAALPARALAASWLVAVATTLSITAVTTCAVVCLAKVLITGGISGRDELTAIGPVCFLLLAAMSASVSSIRGLAAFRAPTAP